MFLVTEIEGKGLGCVAKKKIRRGTLILQEKPCLYQTGENIDMGFLRRIIDVYGKMGEEEKKEYLKLSNKYTHDIELVSEKSKMIMKSVKTILTRMTLTNNSPEFAERIYQICATNAFHNGVCLKMSRFNHSCVPNAEYFWNSDTETRDLRAIRNIHEDEEITVTYLGTEMMTREERRQSLLENYSFWCCCVACDISEEDAEIQREKCEKFRELEQEKKTMKEEAKKQNENFEKSRSILREKEQGKQTKAFLESLCKNTRNEIACLKELYKLAKQMKLIRIITINKYIVAEGFDASCQGFCNLLNPSCLNILNEERNQFLKDANMFADVGLQLSILVNGKEHSTSLEWQKRKQDPIKFFYVEHAQTQIQAFAL